MTKIYLKSCFITQSVNDRPVNPIQFIVLQQYSKITMECLFQWQLFEDCSVRGESSLAGISNVGSTLNSVQL